MDYKGFMGGVYRVCEWIMRLSVTNVLWVLCSLPIFFIGMVILIGLQTGSPEGAIPWLVLMILLSPFLLFPATAALFSVSRKFVMGEEDVPLIKSFFKGYKENYKQSLLGGIIFLLLGALMYTNYLFYFKQSGAMQWLAFLFITFSIILMTAVIHFFSIMVHFHMKFWQVMKNAILVSVGHPVSSVSIIVVNAGIFYIALTKVQFLIPFFMGSFMAMFSFWTFHRIYHRMKLKQEKILAKEMEAEEANKTEDHRES